MLDLTTAKAVVVEGKRWSGADWASEVREVMIVGVGGIGSWLAVCLARIEHSLYIVDGDVVDETNVQGGQMYRLRDIGRNKAQAIADMCREMGCSFSITAMDCNYNENTGAIPIMITALDNMATRRLAFDEWSYHMESLSEGEDEAIGIFIDGRLLLENMEILAIPWGDTERIRKYREEYLFDDKDVPDLDCTVKQSTFGAMTIAGLITATLCNWLTNNKLEMEIRSVPFYQRMYFPIFDNKQINLEDNAKETV